MLGFILAAFSGRLGKPPLHTRRNVRASSLASRPLRIEQLETRDLLSVGLVGTSLSSATARDGQTLTLTYQVSSTEAEQAVLKATLIGPGGETIPDQAHDTTVQLAVGTNTFTRQLFVNLPPMAQIGAYDVVWTVQAASGDQSRTQLDALNVQAPLDIQVPILMYHKVGPVAYSEFWVTTEDFRAQMQALKAYGYTTVTLQDVMNYRAGIATAPAKPIVLTFDDGYENILTDVYPILAELDLKATSFLITSRIGTDNSWDTGDNNPTINLLTWTQIEQLHATGRIDFQSHTHNHWALPYESDSQLSEDLLGSKQLIESHLHKSVQFLCYPYGSTDERVEQAVWEAGYFAATAVGGWYVDKFKLPRIEIDAAVSVDYDPSNPGQFFFNRIEAGGAVPNIAIQSITYRDAAGNLLSGNQLAAGQTVQVRVVASNSGPATSGLVRLWLDADSNHTNGLAYDSHAAGQDLVWNFAGGTQTFNFNWTVPVGASGQYYADVSFVDPYAVLNFEEAGWQAAFAVAPPSSGVALVDASISSSTARDGQTLTLTYQISTAEAQQVTLRATLIGPGGETITDQAHDTTVQLAVGTNTFTRQLFVNLPPMAQIGAYDVVWTVQAASGDQSRTQLDALNVQAPLDIQVPILMYHKVGPVAYSEFWVTTEDFRAQMQALKAYGYTTVTLQDVMNYRAGIATAPAKPIVLTFDDGYENILTDVYPILAELDLKATSFLITSRIGTDNSWDTGDNNPTINLLTWTQIEQLHATGRIDFQSHTHNHWALPYESDSQLSEDLLGSKQLIESHLHKSVQFLCYPYGSTDERVEQAVWEAGYFAATAVGGWYVDKFKLPRIEIDAAVSVDYDPSNPGQFFFNRIEAGVAVPNIAIQSITYRDAAGNLLSGNQLAAGQTVQVRVVASNSGPATSGLVRLWLDADSNHTNGLAYDSHAAGQDLVWNFAGGTQTFNFNWTVPVGASGQYYADVSFVDPYAVLNFEEGGWQAAFLVSSTTNQAPVLGGIETTALTYTENGAAKAITGTLTVSDADNTTLASATVAITAGFNANDVLGFTDQNGITGSYNATTGVLTLTGLASVANYRTALRTVTYRNTSDNPGSVTRTVSVQVNDGGTANNLSNSVSRNIAVTAVNDAPVLAGIETTNLAYTENDTAAITATLTISDLDSANLVGATVSITSGRSSSQDVLGFTNQNGISGSYNATSGVLTLTGTAVVADYQAALRSVTYRNTSDKPSTTTRTISFRVNDGAASSNLSNTLTRTIAITAVNDPPTLAGIETTPLAYTPGSGAKTITSTLTVADPDTTNLTGATVAITDGFVAGQDMLAFTNRNGISGSYNATTGVLTLSGSSSVANYRTALRSVTYRNTSATPNTATRTISFQTRDGAAAANLSNTVTRAVTLGSQVMALMEVTTTAPTISGTESDDTFYVKLDAAGSTVGVWLNAATPGVGAPTFSYLLDAVSVLRIDGLGGDDRVIVDFANGNPLPAGEFYFDGGDQAAGDRLAVVNADASLTTVLSTMALVIDGRTLSYGDAEHFGVGAEAGTAGLVKAGAGLLQIVEPLTYLGATIVDGGTLQVTGNGALPVGNDLTINSGRVSMASTGTTVLNTLFLNLGSFASPAPLASTSVTAAASAIAPAALSSPVTTSTTTALAAAAAPTPAPTGSPSVAEAPLDARIGNELLSTQWALPPEIKAAPSVTANDDEAPNTVAAESPRLGSPPASSAELWSAFDGWDALGGASTSDRVDELLADDVADLLLQRPQPADAVAAAVDQLLAAWQ